MNGIDSLKYFFTGPDYNEEFKTQSIAIVFREDFFHSLNGSMIKELNHVSHLNKTPLHFVRESKMAK